MNIGETRFWAALQEAKPCRVLELGSKVWHSQKPSAMKTKLLSERKGVEWTGFDLEDGFGVDVTGDAHDLSRYFPPSSFDAAVALSCFEHLARPWIVSQQLAEVVRPGGLLLVVTHQTFPYHAYPNDYFRFTKGGLSEVLAYGGWRVMESGHEFPCKVIPLNNILTHARDWNFEAEAWLNVFCFAERKMDV